MNTAQNSGLIMFGGTCGIAGTACYILANVVPLNEIALYVLAMAWPIFSIIFVFSLYQYVALDRQTAANQLAFIFACLGFTLVACMMSVQLAVRLGIEDYMANSPEKDEMLKMIRHSIRLVDQGIDVAWDLFIGTSLIFLSAALKGHARFRLLWSIPSAILGILLIILNIITFPWPPNSKGLFDIGPVIGIYIIALSARLLWLGNRMRHPSTSL